MSVTLDPMSYSIGISDWPSLKQSPLFHFNFLSTIDGPSVKSNRLVTLNGDAGLDACGVVRQEEMVRTVANVDPNGADQLEPNRVEICADSTASSSQQSQSASQQMECNGTPSVQLTAWRVRSDQFDQAPLSYLDNGAFNESIDLAQPASTSTGPYQTLAPENLPRIYPDWNLGLPFIFDEMEEETKGCCGSWRVSHCTLVRWFIVIISLIGLSCVITGVVLGALTVSGSTRLTLCLLMIGVGVVLITVSGLAWRLTSLESNEFLPNSLCLGVPNGRHGNSIAGAAREFPYARVFNGRQQYLPDFLQNTDFVWRNPPPSYQTAMRERGSSNGAMSQRIPGSPPPTYRSRDCALITQLLRGASRPPSYCAPDPTDCESIPMVTFSGPIFSSSMDCNPNLSADTTLAFSDRVSLVQHESWEEQWDSSANDRLAIIDCSEPIPVGFELRHSAYAGPIGSVRVYGYV